MTSYVDLGMPGRMRRKELSERYAFECQCKHCKLEKAARNDGRWVDPREAFACAKEGCSGVGWMPGAFESLPVRMEADASADLERDTGSFESQCNQCGAVRKVDVEQFKGVVEEAESMLARAEARQYNGSSSFFSPRCIPPHVSQRPRQQPYNASSPSPPSPRTTSLRPPTPSSQPTRPGSPFFCTRTPGPTLSSVRASLGSA